LEKEMPLQQEFPAPLIRATLLRRYKRFLADVELDSGERLTVHCPNTGAMTGCAEPGWPVWLSVSDSKTRKYPHTWELVKTAHGMACIHSARANQVVCAAVEAGKIASLGGYPTLRREVKYGTGSRADLVLDGSGCRCVVEVKSVTLRLADGVGAFPDAVSERARKHLTELQSVVEAGERAVIFFCVFHEGIRQVVPARDIDPAYCGALAAALAAGVEAMAWAATITPGGISLDREIPFVPDTVIC
jgi:sugar fermentation stimulation protein A